MDQHSKAQLVQALRRNYRRARKKQKAAIINQLIAATGYSRKHAIARLNGKESAKQPVHRYRPSPYGAIQKPLRQIWAAANLICGKRLKPFLPELTHALVRHGEITLTPQQLRLLSQVSASTIDRLLEGHRRELKPKGRATTKPGTLLKHHIPIRTFADWDDDHPGFLEIDLVAHCGDSVGGEYINTLTLTDIATGWTTCIAFMGRSERFCLRAIEDATQALPFPIRGLDSDNDSVFINAHLKRYCERQSITFTRSRPYKKNDQAHVEQKNWDVVRKTVGYRRLETYPQLRVLRRIWALLATYQNYFQPSRKLISKHRDGAKLHRAYDQAQTPCQRLLARADTPKHIKQALGDTFESTNPAALLRKIAELVESLYQT